VDLTLAGRLSSLLMWNSTDPYEPTREVYRLMPPRRRSVLREALDAAAGAGHDRQAVDRAEPEPVPSRVPAASPERVRRPIASFLGSVAANALGGILATVAVALAVFLWAHFDHASHPPASPPRPSATSATARN
jgi:hypothetical protein